MAVVDLGAQYIEAFDRNTRADGCIYVRDVQQALFGTSLTMADGVLTPAVSVTSAVSGIAVVKASVAHDIVPISIVSPFLPPLPLPARLVPLPSPLPHSRKRTSLVLPPRNTFPPHTVTR